MSAPTPSVSAVIVSYRSEDDLPGAIASLPDWCEVIVVDQYGAGTAGAVARSIRPDATVLRSGANRGFGAGCNLGAANASGEVLLFLNPDARIDEQSLRTLVQACSDADGTVVGPRILGSDGSDETRARRWSSPYRDAATLLVPRQILPGSWNQDIPPNDPRYREGGAVPYVQGSCFVVASRLFWSVGGFDERYFLYGEEETLALRLKERGHDVRLCAQARATHSGHTSTEKVAAFATEQLFRSRVLVYRANGFGRMVSVLVPVSAVVLLLLTAPVRRWLSFRQTEDSTWCRAALRGSLAGASRRVVTPPS